MATTKLQQALNQRENVTPVPSAKTNGDMLSGSEFTSPAVVSTIVEFIRSIECEVVVGGVLQRISFGAGANPAEILSMLQVLDPNVKVRDDFPRKGFGGQRDLKLAKALVLNIRVTDNGKFIDLICQGGDGEDTSIGVSKRSSDTFLDSLRVLNKLSEKNLQKVEKAFTEKGAATVILSDNESFGVKYWTSQDNKSFMDSLVTELPAEREKSDG